MNTSIIISNTTVNNGTMTGKAPHMTSLEIAELTGKNHFDVLRAIRNMEPAWEKVTECKFAVSEYKDSTGRKLPCYSLGGVGKEKPHPRGRGRMLRTEVADF